MKKPNRVNQVSRRVALGVGAVFMAAPRSQAAVDALAAEGALRAFLKAFEDDDLKAMEAAFDEGATAFDPVVAGRKDAAPLDLEALHRQRGMPPAMRALVQSSLKSGSGPPYRKLDPKDLLIQVEGPIAICTFHLEGPSSLARRTIVLVRRNGAWKIFHIHASNAVTA